MMMITGYDCVTRIDLTSQMALNLEISCISEKVVF